MGYLGESCPPWNYTVLRNKNLQEIENISVLKNHNAGRVDFIW